MATTPYYSDPNFQARLQQAGSTQQQFGGPFAATRNVIAQRLQGNRSVGYQNMLNQKRAAAGYQQARFQNRMDWAKWNNQLAMAHKDLVARQQINQQRKMRYEEAKAARKRARSSLLNSAIGVGGAVVGNIMAPGVGGVVGSQVGQMAGSQF